MAIIDKRTFLRDFSKAIIGNEAALFVGAGVSVGAGFVDWRGDFAGVALD